jgi:hypothetical protein
MRAGINTWHLCNQVPSIEEPHTMHGAGHTAGFRWIPVHPRCTIPARVLRPPLAQSAILSAWMQKHRQQSKTSKWGPCYHLKGVRQEIRFSNDYWDSTYFMIFWRSWCWPLYTRECLLYMIQWHLVAEMSSWTVKRHQPAMLYLRLWMWRHFWTLCWSCSCAPNDYRNSHQSGIKTQMMLKCCHYSQLRMKGWLSNRWRKY